MLDAGDKFDAVGAVIVIVGAVAEIVGAGLFSEAVEDRVDGAAKENVAVAVSLVFPGGTMEPKE